MTNKPSKMAQGFKIFTELAKSEQTVNDPKKQIIIVAAVYLFPSSKIEENSNKLNLSSFT